MNSLKRTGRIVGALFLAVMISWSVGDALTGSIFNDKEYLSLAYTNQTKVVTGVLFELIDVIAVIGITVLMFPIFKKRNESMALAYVCFRILEVVALVVALISPVLIIVLSQDYISAGSPGSSVHGSIGKLLLELRSHWSLLMNAVFYNLGALIFYSFLYQLKLIPRFISIWGLVGVSLMLMDCISFELFNITAGSVSGLPVLGLHLGFIEIFLGIWLIIKGFKSS